ncbi:MAG: hypothetical protein CVV05_02295 [Gammaproteobacteria bacterium HGW-Gammaproteobacteria-1]|jgi:hypothetical protein|nr:MAG: hypothetical protein CVV05_02295 [Gammaproteobacteria bacterium HGW-Gammaproteobacteria-1]
MKPQKWAYYISKFTLLDEILGFVYWALAVYGIFLIVGCIDNQVAIVATICVYVVSVVVVYFFLIKKIKMFFKGDSK